MNASRHHFVPQGYLRGFAIAEDSSGSFIWVYDKTADRAPRKKSVKSIAWAPAYYAQEHIDGSPDLDTIENALAKSIDNEIPIILRRMAPEVGVPMTIPAEDRGKLAYFIGLSMTRVPSFRDGINALHTRVGEISLSLMQDHDPKLRDIASKYGITFEAKPWVSLHPMFEMAKAIASAALQKNWQFYIPPPEVPFVTSDNPVVFSGAAAGLKTIGPAHPQSELLLHLRKDLALVCTPLTGHPDLQVFQLRPFDARKFNRGIVRAARRRVFADHKSDTFDEFVKKYAGQEQKLIV
ncbi:MAG: DUF4238 domain-containing protein [Holophagaceae bacterium]|nr:DUF4238 domain-containing protein [Holophagaceae bacterium]